jgi:hypothetical protein
MLATYPLVPLWQSHGVGIAMFSLMGRIYIGLNTDRDLIEDPSLVAKALTVGFDELSTAKPAKQKKPRAAKKAPPMGTR